MTDTQPSGVDLARAALAAARAAAKTRPTEPTRKTRRTRRETRTGGRDPLALSAAITGMMTDRGWEPPEAGGSIIDQWPTIAPELADKVTAERFEHDTGILHLRPASPAYATQLRLFQAQTLRRIQEKTGSRSVRGLRILAPGGTPRVADADTAGQPEQQAAAAPEAPARTRDDGCPGYQNARAIVLEHRPTPPSVNPYVAEAMRRQEAALRAGRQPEDEHRDAAWAQEPTSPARDSVEESLARARAYARQQAAGRTPRRAFDVA
jgi:predicted nucleic acid-binding Zn ribbon protein